MKGKITFLLILIILTGIFLRIYNLGKYDFWYDEVLSLSIAKELKHYDLAEYRTFSDPPLFYFLLSFWQRLGNSEFILRFLPFIFGVLCIPLIYLIGKELFNKRVGLISSFILSMSPFHIYYSQELRAYSLLTFLALMSVYHLIKSLKDNKIAYWACFIIFTTATLYSHNAALFLIIAMNIFSFFSYKRYKVLLSRWLISQVIIFLFYLPWAKILFFQIHYTKALNFLQWLPKGYLINFIRTFLIFNLGCNANWINHLLAMLLIFPLLPLSIWNIKKKEIYLLLNWLFIPIMMSMVFSKLIMFIFLFRTLIYSSPAYYLLISYGLSKIKLKKVFFCFLLFFTILSSISLNNYYRNRFYFFDYRDGVTFKKEIKLASAYIDLNYQNGDLITHIYEASYIPFLYYHRRRREEKLIIPDYEKDKKTYLTKVYPLYSTLFKRLNFSTVNFKEIKQSSYGRFWLILSSKENNYKDQLSKKIKNYLDKNCIILDRKEFVGLRLYLYQNKWSLPQTFRPRLPPRSRNNFSFRIHPRAKASEISAERIKVIM